jgi:hypothetical protein
MTSAPLATVPTPKGRNNGDLLLPPKPIQPEPARLKVTLPAGLAAALDHYARACKAIRQEDVSTDDIFAFVLRRYLKADKRFVAWAKEQKLKLDL